VAEASHSEVEAGTPEGAAEGREQRELTPLEAALARLAEAEAKRDEYLSDLQRVAADFDNFRKRVARDQEALMARAGERLVKELLPVLDDLERAAAVAAQSAGGTLEEGVRMVHRALHTALAKEGLKEVEADGQFDPHRHEALMQQASEAPEGTVLATLQKGYRLGDRVLRPARVVVAGPQPEAPAGAPAPVPAADEPPEHPGGA
jgi:molecular chaperone GrpE